MSSTDHPCLDELLKSCLDIFVTKQHTMEMEQMAEILLQAILSLTKGSHGYITCTNMNDAEKMRYLAVAGMESQLSSNEINRMLSPSHAQRRLSEPSSELTYRNQKSLIIPIQAKKNWLFIPLVFQDKMCGLVGLENNTDIASDELKNWIKPLVPNLTANILGCYMLSQSAVFQHNLFLSTMSHEIRTPLNGIVGMNRILKESHPLNQEQASYIQVMSECTYQLLELINDILDFSKMGCDQLELEYEPFDIRTCLEEVYNLVYLRAQEKKLNLWSDVSSNVPWYVVGDKKRIRQVLLNLVNNAIKFTEAGNIHIRLYIVEEDQDKSGVPTSSDISQTNYTDTTFNTTHEKTYDTIYDRTFNTIPHNTSISTRPFCIHFEVEDTGIGIASRHFSEVFKSFHQIKSQSPTCDGVGLGLAICKKLCMLMKGDISIKKSAPQQGTCMHFFIPFQLASDNFQQTREKELLMNSFQEKRVLVVDISSAQRRIQLLNALGKFHISPFVCSTAEEGMSYLQHMAIDVAVVDYQSQTQDLFHLLQQRGIPIVRLKNDSQPVDNNCPHLTTQHIFSTECAEYFVKSCLLAIAEQSATPTLHESNQTTLPITSSDPDPVVESTVSYSAHSAHSAHPLQSPRSPHAPHAPLPSHVPTSFSREMKSTSGEIQQGSYSHSIETSASAAKPLLLVVEDNPYNLFVIVEMLKKLGYDEKYIDTAKTGPEAIQKAVGKVYDIILMDILLPSIDGIAAATQILSYYRSKCPKIWKNMIEKCDCLLPTVLALTALVTTDMQQKCKQAGFKGFLSKPIDKEELETMLTIICKRRVQSRKWLQ